MYGDHSLVKKSLEASGQGNDKSRLLSPCSLILIAIQHLQKGKRKNNSTLTPESKNEYWPHKETWRHFCSKLYRWIYIEGEHGVSMSNILLKEQCIYHAIKETLVN